MTTVVEARKREQAVAIAKVREEHDSIGVGFSAVIRQEMDRYIARHRDLLPEHLRD